MAAAAVRKPDPEVVVSGIVCGLFIWELLGTDHFWLALLVAAASVVGLAAYWLLDDTPL